jgi:hypothetical protein
MLVKRVSPPLRREKRTARKLPSEYGYIKHWNALMKKSGYGSGLMMGDKNVPLYI